MPTLSLTQTLPLRHASRLRETLTSVCHVDVCEMPTSLCGADSDVNLTPTFVRR